MLIIVVFAAVPRGQPTLLVYFWNQKPISENNKGNVNGDSRKPQFQITKPLKPNSLNL